MTKVLQHGFVGGELSTPMYGRSDDTQYGYGVAKALNFVIRPQGSLRSRTGFEYVSTCKYPERQVRLIPFVYSSTQTAVLELGDHYVRFIINGAVLLSKNIPYEIYSPFGEADLFDIHYEQSADIITFTHTKYAPTQLIRYGAYDWRFVALNMGAKIAKPTGVTAKAVYPSEANEKSKGQVTSTYVVTALDADNHESEKSNPVTVKGNYYITGAYNEISWTAVNGASHYRVYRQVGGVYGYIGATNETSIKDDNIQASTTQTPPRYDNSLMAVESNGLRIASVSVETSGSGYPNRISMVDGSSYIYVPATRPFVIDNADGAQLKIDIIDSAHRIQHYLVIDCDVIAKAGNKALVLPKNMTVIGNSYNMPEKLDSALKVRLSLWQDGEENRLSFLDDNSTEDWQIINQDKYNSFKALEVTSIANDLIAVDGLTISTLITYQQAEKKDVILTVQDTKGTGAKLQAIVSAGSIVAVNVINGGQGYEKPSIKVTSPTGTGASFKVQLEQVGNDYPSANGTFEQRRWLAGTPKKPLSIWATSSGTDNEMSYHLPITATDRINAQAMTKDANRILHILPLQDLIMFTASAEWKVSSSTGGAITPENISVKPQSYFGSTNVQPVIATNQGIYATARGGHLREIGYSRDVYGYLSSDLSLRATHLFDGYRICDLAYQKSPFPRILAVSSSGKLLVATYIPEQSICGWTEFTSTNGVFESICSVPEGGDAGEDALYAVIRRTINSQTVRYIERMGELQEFSDEKIVCLDCSLRGSFSDPVDTIGGLSILEGQKVECFADGITYKDLTVTNGQITLPKEHRFICVGLPIESEVITLPFVTMIQASGRARPKNIQKIYLQLQHKGALEAGATKNKLTPLKRVFLDKYKDEPMEQAGITEESINILGKWSDNGQVIIRKSDCYPIEIVSIALDCEYGG